MNSKGQNIDLSINNLTVKIDGSNIVNDICFELSKGEWLMLVGPNGAGKSTIIRAISKFLTYSGQIFVQGKNIQDINNTDYAKIVGFLSQKNLVAFDYSVEEIVAMGRYCHNNGLFTSLNKDDEDKINWAIEITGLSNLKARSVQELSGGEVQRAFIAQVFAQDPQILILDEPTNNLDLKYQDQIFKLIDTWVKEKHRSVLSVVHDLSLAKLYGTKAVLLKKGSVLSAGCVNEVFSDSNLSKAYEIDVKNYMNNLYKIW